MLQMSGLSALSGIIGSGSGVPPPESDFLLTENGDEILTENGDSILLEDGVLLFNSLVYSGNNTLNHTNDTEDIIIWS